MNEVIKKLNTYAKAYKKSPHGREVEDTPELLIEAANIIKKSKELLKDAAEVIENCYGSETDFSNEIRDFIS